MHGMQYAHPPVASLHLSPTIQPREVHLTSDFGPKHRWTSDPDTCQDTTEDKTSPCQPFWRPVRSQVLVYTNMDEEHICLSPVLHQFTLYRERNFCCIFILLRSLRCAPRLTPTSSLSHRFRSAQAHAPHGDGQTLPSAEARGGRLRGAHRLLQGARRAQRALHARSEGVFQCQKSWFSG